MLKKKNLKKIDNEEPIIDQSAELTKKLISKGKKNGFLTLNEIEIVLKNETSDTLDDFQSKITSMGIQIHENDDEINDDDNKIESSGYKEDEPGKTDDPVRMYLKEMGNVELLSRQGEIEIAKRIEEGKKLTIEAFSSCYISMQYVDDFFSSYVKFERSLRDLIDLDSTYRSISGEADDDVFLSDEPKDEKDIYTETNTDNDIVSEAESEFENEHDSENNDDISELSILEKEENLRPVLLEQLTFFQRNTKN